jgi:hypothetical protein
MADYYIYLPVYDLELAKVARSWKTSGEEKSQKTYEIIERRSTGFKKWVSRKVMRGALKNVAPVATVNVLAHGYSAGKEITGPEAEARSVLSKHGGNYEYLKKQYPEACQACEKDGYADPKDGYEALEDALDDDASYKKVVKLFTEYMDAVGAATITIERPGALRIGGTRPDGSSKTYAPGDFYRRLKREKLPQVPRLKIFACNTGITPQNEMFLC